MAIHSIESWMPLLHCLSTHGRLYYISRFSYTVPTRLLKRICVPWRRHRSMILGISSRQKMCYHQPVVLIIEPWNRTTNTPTRYRFAVTVYVYSFNTIWRRFIVTHSRQVLRWVGLCCMTAYIQTKVLIYQLGNLGTYIGLWFIDQGII